MKGHSICFVILLLLLSAFLGSVIGSLIETIFGINFLNYELLPGKGVEVKDFYIIKELRLQLTPSTILGMGIAIFLLYKYSNH